MERHHVIKVDALANTYVEPLASSTRENKRLEMLTSITPQGDISTIFVVKQHDDVRAASRNLNEAVVSYNNITWVV